MLEKKNPIVFNPDGESLNIYPNYTEFRPIHPLRPNEIIEPLIPTRKNVKRLQALDLEIKSNELLPGEENDPLANQIVESIESRIYPNRLQRLVDKSESKRGCITCISRKSATRLKKLLARTIGLDIWIDLTFADDVFEHQGYAPGGTYIMPFADRMKKAYECLNEFERVVKSLGLYYIWKKEIQPRKSGIYKGSRIPHYHVCLVGLSPWQKDNYKVLCIGLLEKWVRITGTNHPKALQVALKIKNGEAQSYRFINNSTMAIKYISKYFSKTDPVKGNLPGTEKESIGRAWGYSRDLPQLSADVVYLTPQESMVVRRVVRKMLKLKSNKKFIGLKEQLQKGYSTYIFIPRQVVFRILEAYTELTREKKDLVPF